MFLSCHQTTYHKLESEYQNSQSFLYVLKCHITEHLVFKHTCLIKTVKKSKINIKSYFNLITLMLGNIQFYSSVLLSLYPIGTIYSFVYVFIFLISRQFS